jgi:EF hand
MALPELRRAVALAVLFAITVAGAGAAQTPAADPHHPGTALAQVPSAPESGGATGQGQRMQPGQPGTMPPAMMGQGMMGRMMQPGMMGGMAMMGMHGPMMKIMFVVADVNGDGGLSFEEVTTVHRRIFERVDSNKDGKVTPEEVQIFMRESP